MWYFNFLILSLLATQPYSVLAGEPRETITHRGNTVTLVGASVDEGEALAQSFDYMLPDRVLNVMSNDDYPKFKEVFSDGWPETLQNISAIRRIDNLYQIGFGGEQCESFTITFIRKNCGDPRCEFEPREAQWRTC